MAAPVFFCDAPPGAKPGDVVTVTGPEGHHAAQVARLRTGEDVELVDGDGQRLIGHVTAVAKNRIDVQISSVTRETPPDPRIIVVQALPKGERAERAVESMTEVGVDVIVPWSAANCVARGAVGLAGGCHGRGRARGHVGFARIAGYAFGCCA